MDNPTLAYYNEFAEEFAARMASIPMQSLYDRFLPLIPAGGHILDAGCGSGRDLKFFSECGYRVSGIDASAGMVAVATRVSGQPVRQLDFLDLDDRHAFDGIWCCASLLHVSEAQLPEVLARLVRAAKTGGILFMSFKEGNFSGLRHGRFFTDLTQPRLRELLAEHPLEIVELFRTADQRAERVEEYWTNAVVRKIALASDEQGARG